MIFHSFSEKETEKLGRNCASCLQGGEILALSGPLGSGKTAFTKGLARGLGIRERVKSPSFILRQDFKVKARALKIRHFLHLDAYRLKTSEDFFSLGVKEWLGEKNVVGVVEWPQRVKGFLKKYSVLKIRFRYGKRENERVIDIPPVFLYAK
jgi:tRNA threonylcarbamoyladenosine biosynthesis protein TsaE